MGGITFLFAHPFSPVSKTSDFVLLALLASVVFCAIVFAMHKLSPQAKKWMTIACTFIAGLYFTLEFFIPPTMKMGENGLEPKGNFLTPSITPISDFVINITVWSLGLGIISLLIVHGRKLIKRMPGWHNSLAFFVALIAFSVVGIWTKSGNPDSTAPDTVKTIYNSLFFGLFNNLDAAMFSLLAFYIASAAYRAFRVRTVEAGLLMGAALIVMLGLVNFGVAMTSWIPTDSFWAYFRMENMSSWIMNWINMPAYRAVIIGVGVGALAMGLRLWLSLERGTFFSQEK